MMDPPEKPTQTMQPESVQSAAQPEAQPATVSEGVQPVSADRLIRIKKNRLKKKIIGLLLIIAIAYFILSNFDLGDLPLTGMIITGESTTCTEIRGPSTMTDTEVRDLQIEDRGFQVLRNENKATISIRNTDNQSGSVRVMLFCSDGTKQGEDTRTLDSGETQVFNFLDVRDCELDYMIEPGVITARVEKTTYTTDTVCE